MESFLRTCKRYKQYHQQQQLLQPCGTRYPPHKHLPHHLHRQENLGHLFQVANAFCHRLHANDLYHPSLVYQVGLDAIQQKYQIQDDPIFRRWDFYVLDLDSNHHQDHLGRQAILLNQKDQSNLLDYFRRRHKDLYRLLYLWGLR